MLSKKQEISNCAARLFRKRGFRATSMRDIAHAMNMKAASLYNHIVSKEQLFCDILLKMANMFTVGMQEIISSSLDTSEKLNRAIALHVKLSIQHTDAISLVAGEWVHLPEAAMHDYLQHKDAYEKDFRTIIEQGKSEGLYKDMDTEIILFSILSTLRGLYSWVSKNKDYNPIELEQKMIVCLTQGIKK